MKIRLIAVGRGRSNRIQTVYFVLNSESQKIFEKYFLEGSAKKTLVETDVQVTRVEWNKIQKLLRRIYWTRGEVKLRDDELVFIYNLEERRYSGEIELFGEIVGRLPKETAERLTESVGVMALLT